MSSLLDPSTGAVKALWSYPSYDPNLIASHDFEAAKAAKIFYDAAPGKPLLANSYQERYLPGSTFKVVTATAALESGLYTLDSEFPPVELLSPAADDRPDRELRGDDVWRDVRGGLPPELQHGLRRDGRQRRGS